MTPALAPPARSDCDYVKPSDWRCLGEPVGIVADWCEHDPEQSKEFERIAPRRRPRQQVDALRSIPAHLRRVIEASRAILDLEVDDEEARTPYAEETWKRAGEFLKRYAIWLGDTRGVVLDAPDILPGPDGSIDLHWDYPGYEMLINIPADATTEAGFYGDDRAGTSIKGKFDANTINDGLLLWLTKSK